MSKNKTSDQLTAEADDLLKKLAELRKEARKMKKLEDQQKAEAKRQEDIEYALEFVEFAKHLRFQEGGVTFFDIISKNMEERRESPNENAIQTASVTQDV